jgi:hypothetical protein
VCHVRVLDEHHGANAEELRPNKTGKQESVGASWELPETQKDPERFANLNKEVPGVHLGRKE